MAIAETCKVCKQVDKSQVRVCGAPRCPLRALCPTMPGQSPRTMVVALRATLSCVHLVRQGRGLGRIRTVRDRGEREAPFLLRLGTVLLGALSHNIGYFSQKTLRTL